MAKFEARLPVLMFCVTCFLACTSEQTPEPKAKPTLNEARARSAIATYAAIAHESYADSLSLAREFDARVTAFVASPSANGLEQLQAAWLRAREPYVQTEVFRFYDGPIDRVEAWINSWPIDENIVDATEPGLPPGVIGDRVRYPEIDEALLLKLNGAASETSISSGYHVIEFLLWGKDTRADGPGARTHEEFEGEAGSLEARRTRYLQVASRLLVKQLGEVEAAWRGGRHENFRAQFTALPAREALGLILKGMGALSGPELAGERLMVAYETKDQENEHSCFSDSTHLDMVGDAQGIENLCLGRYQKRDGSTIQGEGMCALVSSMDPALGHALEQQVRTSVVALRAIPAPFDQAIRGADQRPGRKAVLRAIRSLEDQTQTIVRAAAVLGANLGLATAQAQLQ